MPERSPGPQWPGRWAGEPLLYLTTIGRRTGRPHRIEIWFAAHDGGLYLLSGGRERADWVRNLRTHPQVTVELGDETRVGLAHVLDRARANVMARTSAGVEPASCMVAQRALGLRGVTAVPCWLPSLHARGE
jgi:deazaflavin-dependent oxidoreductase (nitroreductase family)